MQLIWRSVLKDVIYRCLTANWVAWQHERVPGESHQQWLPGMTTWEGTRRITPAMIARRDNMRGYQENHPSNDCQAWQHERVPGESPQQWLPGMTTWEGTRRITPAMIARHDNMRGYQENHTSNDCQAWQHDRVPGESPQQWLPGMTTWEGTRRTTPAMIARHDNMRGYQENRPSNDCQAWQHDRVPGESPQQWLPGMTTWEGTRIIEWLPGSCIHYHNLTHLSLDKMPDISDNVFRCILVNEKFYIFIKVSLKFVPMGRIGNNPALV